MELKITIIIMLRARMEKVEKMNNNGQVLENFLNLTNTSAKRLQLTALLVIETGHFLRSGLR